MSSGIVFLCAHSIGKMPMLPHSPCYTSHVILVFLKQWILQTILLFYLTVTGAALLYTLFHIHTPVPWALVRFSYTMMAPYQGDTEINEDLVAFGEYADRSTKIIDLDRYIPGGKGERNVRKYLRSFRRTEDDLQVQKYTDFAEQLFARERKKDPNLTSVTLNWHAWPRSPQGFDALRTPPHLVATFITRVR